MNKKQKGASLLEAMFALAVSSIGMLGMAGMEIIAKGTSSEAIERTASSMYVSEMVDRMRSNPNVLADYVGTTVGGATLSTPSKNCGSENCTEDELVTYDLWSWEQQLDGAAETRSGSNTGGISSPTACIEGPVAGGAGVYTVSVAWKGKTALKNPTSHSCGSATTLYGTGNNLRRVMFVTFYVNENGSS